MSTFGAFIEESRHILTEIRLKKNNEFEKSNDFKGLLKETDKAYPQDNKQVDIVISNPPYPVPAFKSQMEEETAKKSFDLYNRPTGQSSEMQLSSLIAISYFMSSAGTFMIHKT